MSAQGGCKRTGEGDAVAAKPRLSAEAHRTMLFERLHPCKGGLTPSLHELVFAAQRLIAEGLAKPSDQDILNEVAHVRADVWGCLCV
jgi:hypothetical protein